MMEAMGALIGTRNADDELGPELLVTEGGSGTLTASRATTSTTSEDERDERDEQDAHGPSERR